MTNIDAERSVLGAAMQSPEAASKAVELLVPKDFSDRGHREIFDAILTLSLKSLPVDLQTVDGELERRGMLATVGGPEALIAIYRGVPSSANVEAYIRQVREQADRRRLGRLADAITSRVGEGAESDRLIEMIEATCSDMVNRRDRDAGWITLGDALLDAYAMAENPERFMETGFAELDETLCGGLRKGELTIVGARPGKGKSAFLLAAGLHMAEAGFNVGYFSLEMSTLQIAQRAQAAASGVSITRQRRGRDAMREEDWDLMAGGLERFGVSGIGERFHIYEAYGMTIERLSAIARHVVRRGEIDVIILDYLQLMQTAQRTNKDFERLGIVSRALKQLALQLDIPILTAAQVRRQDIDSAKRGGRAPTMDELRGSGDLEQDADNVLLIHTPDSPEDPTLKALPPGNTHSGIWERALFATQKACLVRPFTVEVAKQRQGATGRTWCLFMPALMRFAEDGG